MTRSTKSLFSIVTVVAAMAATAVPAMGESSFVGSPDAIVGADGLRAYDSHLVADASDGFNWGDAAVGTAVGLVLAPMLAAAYSSPAAGGPECSRASEPHTNTWLVRG